MGRVVEQRPGRQPEDPRDEPTRAGGQPSAGGQPADGSAVAPVQPPLDPEQLRQFQQFQQFQDFLRYSEAQRQGNGQMVPAQNAPVQSAPGYGAPPVQPGQGGPPMQPPYGQLQPATPQLPEPRPKIKAPRWAKRLAGKVLSAVLLLVVLVIAGKLAYNHFFPSNDEDLPAAMTGGGTYRTNEILSTNPYEAARQVYQQVAQGQPDRVCGLFETETQQKFATDLNYADCREAVLDLKKQVTDMTAYAGSLPFGSISPVQGTVVRIDSCDYSISGGPALGTFVVTKVGDQWLITGHEPGPRTCAPVTPTSR